jgi:LCP family protein required for cell wall assembly
MSDDQPGGPSSADPSIGPWGPSAEHTRGMPPWVRVLAVLGVAAIVGITAIATTGVLLVQRAEASLTRVPVPQLDQVDDSTGPSARHFLIVGSDSRAGLSAEERRELSLGSFEGQRADTIMYVAISADRETISIVSLPRDLLVYDANDRPRKITDVFAGGADDLVGVIQSNFGLPINHYAAMSLGGFVEVVNTLGEVEVCLERPLRDRKSGADFEEGCHDMDAREALSYVRSRSGPRSDFERIDRQQRFIRSVLTELTDARVLADPPRLFHLIEDVAGNLETDEDLTLNQMRRLADDARQVVTGGIPMTAVPAYPQTIDGLYFVVAYGPGAREMFDDLREGRPIRDRGTPEQRAETVVSVWSGGRATEQRIVIQVLSFAGFLPGGAGTGPEALDAGGTTVVYAVPGNEEQAGWVAATLGTTVETLPDDVAVPEGADVIVAVGSDASS